MQTTIYLSAGVLVLGALAAGLFEVRAGGNVAKAGFHTPELEYWKAVNASAPPQDPQFLFLLMGAYSNSGLWGEGAEFLTAKLNEFSPRLSDPQKSLYLSAIGMLRAQNAPSVSVLHRIGYVKQTIAMLQQAKRLSGGNIYVVHWIAGVVYAQLPGFFHQRAEANAELAWCESNAARAPHAGWLREVYYQQGKLALADGNQSKAQDYLRRSGYRNFDKPITLITPFAEDAATGHTFSPRRIAEVVPGRVYVLSGFEFTEYYFVVSEDRKQLIGIDAGTRPDAAKAAYEALQAYAPGLPPLTTILVTHSHWDHVGGHSWFRSLTPRPRFYARSNYQEQIDRELKAPGNFDKRFFGENFRLDDVRSFKADVTIDRETQLNVGGTHINLIPIPGGETLDAMLIHLPDQGVMFAGDFIMPYLGAPFVPEGDFDGLLKAIDVVVEKQPRFLLHGHEPLTRNFSSVPMLAHLKTHLEWLRGQVLQAIQNGQERGAIQQANLIPPALLTGPPEGIQAYFIMREHVIDRLFDQNTGYWQAGLEGIDHLTRADRAELLVDYLGLSERQLVKAVERLSSEGKYEQAAYLLESSAGKVPASASVAQARRLVYLKLMEKHQNTDPFKYILYSAQIAEPTPPIALGK